MNTWIIDLVASVLGLTCVFLAGRNSKYNFWVGYLYTAALFVLFRERHLYANLLLQPISLGINILGHYRWTHPREGERSAEDASALKVSLLSWGQRGLCIAVVLLTAFAWGWTLDRLFPSDPHPYLDAVVTMLILLAQFPSALKKWDCWVAWLLVNVAQSALHGSVGNPFLTIVSGLYLVNGCWSLYSWMKRYKNNG